MAATADIDFARFAPEAPALVGVGWISETYEIAVSTIYLAIKERKLPVIEIPGGKGSATYAADPDDVFALWGVKLIARQMKEAAKG